MSDVWIRVRLRAVWEGPPQPDGARPGPEQAAYEAEWLVPFVPAMGDTLMLPDGEDGTSQGVTVSERIIELDGTVSLWLDLGRWHDGGSDWTREGIEGLMNATRQHAVTRLEEFDEENRQPMQLTVGESLTNLYRLARRAEHQGRDDADQLRITVPEGGDLPEVDDDVLIVDDQERSCVAHVVAVVSRQVPRPHTAVMLVVEWGTLAT